MALYSHNQMEILVNKLLKTTLSVWIAIATTINGIPPAFAQSNTSSICPAGGVTFGFFNGVQTTFDDAEEMRKILQLTYGTTTANGEPIQYELFYNQTTGLSDFVETFEQRLSEQNGLLAGRFELFFESVRGDGPLWRKIVAAVSSTAGILSGLVDSALSFAAAGLVKLVSVFTNTPPTNLNYQEHRLRIDNAVLTGKKMLFLSHSQGNLFANVAYDYALTKVTAANVKLVHVAPASPGLRGSHTLADQDLVINGLRLTGTVPSNTDTIPTVSQRTAGLNGKKDALGHGLLEIYMAPQHATAARMKSHVDTALAALVAPEAKAKEGLFTATLSWNGPGDVDLHAYEPGGAHVYWMAKRGQAGYLDVDNTIASGPEHYYASCSPTELQTGEYQFAVANFDKADGLTAVVQIASRDSGVLGTRSVVLGAPTLSVPSSTLFTVEVTRDPTTGVTRVGLGR